MIGCLPTQALAFLAVFVYTTQAIAFEWKAGFNRHDRLTILITDSVYIQFCASLLQRWKAVV